MIPVIKLDIPKSDPKPEVFSSFKKLTEHVVESKAPDVTLKEWAEYHYQRLEIGTSPVAYDVLDKLITSLKEGGADGLLKKSQFGWRGFEDITWNWKVDENVRIELVVKIEKLRKFFFKKIEVHTLDLCVTIDSDWYYFTVSTRFEKHPDNRTVTLDGFVQLKDFYFAILERQELVLRREHARGLERLRKIVSDPEER